MNRMLRCYAYGRPNDWEAICIDLDIAVNGTTLQEVTESLGVCISLYLEAVANSPEEDQHRLLHRRSPWHVRAKLACWARLPWISSGVSGPMGFSVSERQLPSA